MAEKRKAQELFPCRVLECPDGFYTKQAEAAHYFSAHERKVGLKEIDHGTSNGYVMHRRRDESACADCRKAWNERIREKRSRK